MRQSYKTILLWVVLIVVFIAIYQVFSTPPNGEARPEHEWNAMTWICPGIALLAIGGFVWLMRKAQRTQKLNNEGIQLLNQGRYSQALEKFTALAKLEPKSPIAPFNIGTVQLALWRTGEACAQFEKTWQMLEKPPQRVTVHASPPDAVKAVVPQHAALACALHGDVARANEWLSKAIEGPQGTRWAILSRAALACRNGDFATAVRELDHFEVKQIGGGTGALASTLRAWAIERTTGELRHVDRVLLFGETGPETLQKVWPELAAFVERAPAA